MKTIATIFALLFLASLHGFGTAMAEDKGVEFLLGCLLQGFSYVFGFLIAGWYWKGK